MGPVVAMVMIGIISRKLTLGVAMAAFLCAPIAAADKAPAKPVEPKPVVIHVTEGCDACAGLLAYMKSAGVKLEAKKAERSKYPAFPTVDYSDGGYDHGERIYGKKVAVPKAVKVISCNSGD